MDETEDSTIRPLVSTLTSAGPLSRSVRQNSPPRESYFSTVASTCSKNHQVCLRSGTAILILLWNIIVGIVYGALQIGVIAASLSLQTKYKDNNIHIIQVIAAGLAAIAVIQILLFPFGGLLADIWQGRYRIIHFSFVKITIGFIFLCIGAALSGHKSATGIALSLCLLFLSLGFAGFQSNAIQFGLDQLHDASSQELSLFLHWYVWTNSLGELMARMLGSWSACDDKSNHIILIYPPSFIAGICAVLLLFAWYKRHSFHCEPKCNNPYGTVLRVLKFVAKHKYPLRRSARTYCGDMTPTRMDYANTVFGGPYSVEVVEDVKTFLRMFVMMLCICPVFFYNISISSLYPLYGLYLGKGKPRKCSIEWFLLESGNVSHIVTCLTIPLYVVFLFPKVTRLIPRILHRLIIGTVILVAAVAIMWLFYLIAITQNQHMVRTSGMNQTDIQCLFYAKINTSNKLNFNTAFFVIPEIMTGIAFPVINIAVLEFVSAQSPFPMKGLLLGTFYALRGMFILLGCSSIYIFTARPFKNTKYFSGCGFIFYGVNIFLGIVCVCVSIKAVKWYQYRKREEQPYDHRYVEDYYSRYASKTTGSGCHGNTHEESRHNYGSCQNSNNQVNVYSE